MQSSARNPNQRYLTNKTETKKKSVLPFSKQLLSLQKKIQQVEDKNELILQRIHKAYDFKKSKNKVYYEAPGMGEEEGSFQNVELQQRVPGLLNLHAERTYPSLQPQYIQPRQFDVSNARRNSSMVPTPSQIKYFSHVEFQPQNQQHRLSQGPYQKSDSPQQPRLDLVPFYHQQHQEVESNYEVEDQQNQHQQSQQNLASEFSQGEVDFKSSSNYSDVQRRKTINDNFRKRQKDFSDIMSSIQDRRGQQERRQLKKPNKKSYIYNITENNSLYSQGHIPSKEKIEHKDLQVIQRPVTIQHPNLNRPRQPYKRPMNNLSSQERIGVHSTNQLQYMQPLVSQNRTLSTIPHPPSLPMMVHSLSAHIPQGYQSQPSSNEVTFLQDMYKVERQKTLSLERQMLKKEENIEHLKKYKKSFKKFFQNTHYVIEQAFDQFVETFLRNRVYKIEKVVKKNENRLSALVLQLKDLKQEREYTKSLKSLSTKIAKRSYSSNEQTQKRSVQNQNEQQGLEQNYSWVSSRSVSAKNRRSKDKSLTKKSNQSHIVMKKEFNNIAENYQAMIKVKNEEIEKYQTELKQAKFTIQSLQEDNNRLKIQLQHYITRPQIPQPPLIGNNVESDNGKKTSGNLRILSRNPSRTEIKKGMNSPTANPLVQQNQKLLQKIKNLQQQVQRFSSQNSSLQQQLDSIHKQHLEKETQLKEVNKQLSFYQKELIPQNKQRVTELQASLYEVNKHYQQLNEKNLELDAELEILREHLNQKEMKILQLDSQLYLKKNELKKAQNLLTLKNHKLEQFNKFLLQPSGQQPLNDSISSAFQDPQNKTTFLMLQNLQKQLEQEKYEKEVEFLKLKKSYQAKIQQLKIQLEEIALENQKLAQRLNTDDDEKRKLQEQKQQLTENNQNLKLQIQKLKEELSFLNDKINFFQVERKTAAFIKIPKGPETHHLSENNFDHLKPQILQQQDFDDFPTIEENLLKTKENSPQTYKPPSGEIQLLNDSSATGSFDLKKTPSLENQIETNRGAMNQNMQQKLSLLKDENIELSQKVAKLQKENKFLKESESQLSQKQEDMKKKMMQFTEKYLELQKHNNDLLKMVQELEKEKNEMMSTIKQPLGSSTFDWKEVERNIEPVDLKGSGLYSPWTFMEKDDMLLEKSADIRSSIISNFHANRPSYQSRESTDKRIDQLTKKLSETQLLLENKEKINEELIIGFTKKIDKLNTQLEDQAKEQSKVIEKYIQENSRLRKEKERLEEEVNGLKSQLIKIKERSPKKQSPIKQSLDQNIILEEQEQGIQGEQAGGLDMLEQRIGDDKDHGFMLGINEVDYSPEKTPKKQNSKDNEKEKEKSNYESMLLEGDIMEFEDLEQKQEKIQLLQKQVQDLEETVQKLQKFLEETLNKVKSKEEEKTSLVEELQKKNYEVEELRDLIELKETGKSNTLNLSKSINNFLERPSLDKSERPRMSSNFSLKLSQTNHGERQRRASFDDQINFDLSESNNRSNLQQSHLSGIYSENMSMIFEKEENFLDQINKAKRKRKQEGKLVKKTFEYIKKLRGSLNDKSRKIKILQMRLQELKDNCWLWRKNVDNMPGQAPFGEHPMQMKVTESKVQGEKDLQHNYLDQNQSLSDSANDRMVDSRVFQCNSEDLNKKKPHRHNHYKKMEFDTKLIVEENRILTKQIEMLQEELIKIEEQENGLMAVKEIYKEEIRSLTRQNQQQATAFQQQIQKLQDILQCSEAVHNYEAIKQLFKRIIDNIGVILYPNTSPQAKKKSANQLKQQKKKETEECIKVICSILNYEEGVKNDLCLRLTGQCQG